MGKMMFRKCLIPFMLLIVFFSQNVQLAYSFGEFDKTAVVEWVIDGDTFRTDIDETIRLADINTPEIDESGYWEATNYMISTVKNKDVFLDIDDKYTYDDEGQGPRLVCVVYVDYNQTHYLNVNKALIENGLAVTWDHDNQFNPSKWNLFVLKSEIPEFPSWTILPFVLMATFSGIIIKKRLISKS
ncbi:MAG: thermonuclease family protein [Candidatus Bathyarchaeota archaeon]|nr:thermonuclease family protein [Candidatus Bathyarchaeum sp.]